MKDLMNYFNKNKSKWMEELVSKWKTNQWTDCSFDEYASFKVWSYTYGEDYFKAMLEYCESNGEKTMSLESIKQDAWNIYLLQLGFDRKPFGEKLNELLQNNKEKEGQEWLKN